MITPDTVSELPKVPGVYLMKSAQDQILYVGKAVNLRSRVSSYFRPPHHPRTALMVSKVHHIDFVATENEVEALILESNLVKEHKPRFNILLRDDKHFPYIKITTNEDWPRLEVVRGIRRDKGTYFGPYPSSSSMRRVIGLINKYFRLRKRRTTIDDRVKKPCLNYQIGRCLAPCAHKVDQATYQRQVQQVLRFLEGDSEALVAELQLDMQAAASAMEFERAAQLRDQIEAVEAVLQKQKIIDPKLQEWDAFAVVQDGDLVEAQLLTIRRGHILGQRNLSLKGLDPDAEPEALEAFLKQHYAQGAEIPPTVLLDRELDSREALQSWLEHLANRKVELRFAQRGQGRRLVEMAEKNARLGVQARRAQEGVTPVLERLQEILSLSTPPRRIECIDNSNFQGSQPVASLVVCINGEMERREYRKYKIRTVVGPDDFATMTEVVGRRLDRLLAEKRELPDLLLVDGGKGQLGAALEAVAARGLLADLEVAGIAKGRKNAPNPAERVDRIFRPNNSEPCSFGTDQSALRLLQKIRDEAHRFAITFHGKRQRKESLRSILDELPGVGKVRKKALLGHFRSIQKIQDASVEQLAEVPGLNTTTAQRIHAFLQQEKEKSSSG